LFWDEKPAPDVGPLDALIRITNQRNNGRICLSNNAAERALRGVALGRMA
jgi:hypothetical protein